MKWKINPHHSEDWEFDFSPLGEVPCDYCGTLGIVVDMLEVRKHGTVEPINLCFCGEPCANEWYLKHLRKSGL